MTKHYDDLCMWLAAIVLIIATTLILATKAVGSPCLSKSEARAVYPQDHIYRHQGCWYSKRPAKPQIDLNDKRVADANGSVAIDIVDATNVPLDAFIGPHEPLRTYMVPELKVTAAKSDRLDAVFEEEAAKPQQPVVQPEPVVPPKEFPKWERMIVAWFLVACAAMAGCALAAISIAFWRQRQHRSMKDVVEYARIPTARIYRHLKRGGKQAPARSDGPRDQQPYIYPRHIFDEWWGINERGHGRDPSPPADRADDFSALGAWARSRGFRAEAASATASETVTNQHGQTGKRDSWWRRALAG